MSSSKQGKMSLTHVPTSCVRLPPVSDVLPSAPAATVLVVTRPAAASGRQPTEEDRLSLREDENDKTRMHESPICINLWLHSDLFFKFHKLSYLCFTFFQFGHLLFKRALKFPLFVQSFFLLFLLQLECQLPLVLQRLILPSFTCFLFSLSLHKPQ